MTYIISAVFTVAGMGCWSQREKPVLEMVEVLLSWGCYKIAVQFPGVGKVQRELAFRKTG